MFSQCRAYGKTVATIFVALGLLWLVPAAYAAASPLATTPPTKLARKIIVGQTPTAMIWSLSTAQIRFQLPKRNVDSETARLAAADDAWFDVKIDRKQKVATAEIRWQDIGVSAPTPYSKTRFKLPSGNEQAGPSLGVSHAGSCLDESRQTDEFGLVYRYERTCRQIVSYSIPITIDVISFLADRMTSDPETPLSVTLDGDGQSGKVIERTFNFYPAEAKALMIEFEKLKAQNLP